MKEDKCMCPICRFTRGEITAKEIGWYLKGCIEKESAYLRMIKEASTIEELREKIKFNDLDLDGDYQLLHDLKDEKQNIEKWWDPAMDQPENYVMKD